MSNSVSVPRLPAFSVTSTCFHEHMFMGLAVVHFLFPVNHFITFALTLCIEEIWVLSLLLLDRELNQCHLHSSTCFSSRISLYLAVFICPSTVVSLPVSAAQKHVAVMLHCTYYSCQVIYLVDFLNNFFT